MSCASLRHHQYEERRSVEPNVKCVFLKGTLICIFKTPTILMKIYEDNACNFFLNKAGAKGATTLAIKMVIMDTWMCQRRSPPIVVYGGSIHKTSSSKYNQGRHFHLKEVKIFII
jgi:hypothetical protein